nr:MAG TPA: hypothetical protein [Caudoviricetes sp.]DAM88765.1 MAG TPA: hypothetical protein [Caudoviricetes sp.]
MSFLNISKGGSYSSKRKHVSVLMPGMGEDV